MTRLFIEHPVTTTATQYTTIKSLLQELKPHRGSNNYGRNHSRYPIPNGDDMCKFKNAMQHCSIPF